MSDQEFPLETVDYQTMRMLRRIRRWLQQGHLVLDGDHKAVLHDIVTMVLASEPDEGRRAGNPALHSQILIAKDALQRKASLFPEEIQLLARLVALSGLYDQHDRSPGLYWQMEVAVRQFQALQTKSRKGGL